MRGCYFCGGREDEVPGPWIRAEFLDSEDHERWVCSRGRDAYLPGEPDDELPDLNTCRGRLLDEWRRHAQARVLTPLDWRSGVEVATE